MIGILRRFIKDRVKEIENYIDRYISRQSDIWKSNIEEWNKKFPQWGIRTNNIVNEEPPRIVKINRYKNIDLTKIKNRNLAVQYEMPAAFIGAYEATGNTNITRVFCASSGNPPTKNIEDIAKLSMDFRKCIDRVGKIGEKGIDPDNIIGRCAEFHAVYGMLRLEANFYKIRLTRAFRVRYTSARIGTIHYCDNCKKMFEGTKILDKEEG